MGKFQDIRKENQYRNLGQNENILEVYNKDMRDKRFTLILKRMAFGQMRIQICDYRLPMAYSPEGHGSIEKLMDTYDFVTAMATVAELKEVEDVELYVELKRKRWNSEGNKDRIRLDNKLTDRLPDFIYKLDGKLEGKEKSVMFKQEEFEKFVVATQALKLFPEEKVVLKSGRESRWYVNWRSVTQSAVCLDKLSDFITGFCADKNLRPNCFYGVPEGATKLGIVTQMKWALAHAGIGDGVNDYDIVPMGRGKTKDHGDPKDANYVCAPKKKVVVLEDVATTAGSMITAIKNLQSDLGDQIEIIAAIVLTDRCQVDVASLLKEQCGVDYYALSSADKLIPAAFEMYGIEEGIKQEVIQEYNENSIKPLAEV